MSAASPGKYAKHKLLLPIQKLRVRSTPIKEHKNPKSKLFNANVLDKYLQECVLYIPTNSPLLSICHLCSGTQFVDQEEFISNVSTKTQYWIFAGLRSKYDYYATVIPNHDEPEQKAVYPES